MTLWTVNQTWTGTVNAATQLSAAPTNNIASANSVVLAIVNLDASTAKLVSGFNNGAGFNGAQLVHFDHSISGRSDYVDVWAVQNSGDVGTKPTYKITWGVAVTTTAMFVELTNVAVGQTAGVLLENSYVGQSYAAGATSPVGPPAFSSTKIGDLLLYILSDPHQGNTDWTGPGGSYTTVSDDAGGATFGSLMLAYKSSTGAGETGTWSSAGTIDGGSLMLAIVTPGSTNPPSAGLPIPFNPSWLILHQAGFEAFFQQPTPLTLTSIPASPTAGIATASVAAPAGTAALTGLPDTPNVTAAGLAALPLLTGLPDTPNVTVGAFNASVNIAGNANANAGLANVNAAALNVTVPIVTALPQSANVTVAANLPNASATGLTVVGAQFPITYLLAVYGTAIIQVPVTQSGTNDTALPQSTNVTVAALGPVPALTGLPDTPNVTATSPPSTAALTGLPDTPNVTAAGLAPTPHVTVIAQVAAVTVTAYNPSVNVGGNVNVTPGVGNVVVAALNASVTAQGNVTANAQLASVTVAAIGPASNVNPTLTVAAVVIAAFVAAPKIAGRPPTANVVVEAAVLNVSGTGAHIGRLTAGTARTATLTADDSPLSSQDSQDNT